MVVNVKVREVTHLINLNHVIMIVSGSGDSVKVHLSGINEPLTISGQEAATITEVFSKLGH